MNALAVRSRAEEQMDSADLDPAVYEKVLADLARVNRWTLTARPTLAFLKRAAAGMTGFTLLDVGFGHGDMLRAIHLWASRRGISARLVGVDLNGKSVTVARAATPPEIGIEYREGRYQELEGPFDFVISAQVAHHMTDQQLIEFIRYMESTARRGWLISDLHRHGFAWRGFPLLARLMGVHRIVREDGRLSIARSFRPHEWRSILADAGMNPAAVTISRHFPFRLCVQRLF
jgi:2-polyprenyl-3-methyl-5-hydroxy-6-metoxy-1,4-benzoquinol methylase